MTLEATLNLNDTTDGSRDAKGRFKVGNHGGPGNPNAGKLAQFRQLVLNMATPEDMKTIARKLVDMAIEGHWQAIKLVLLYTCGKPEKAHEMIGEYGGSAESATQAPSPNGEIQGQPTPIGDLPQELPLANGVFQETAPSPNGNFSPPSPIGDRQLEPPSANGDFQETAPSPNGNSSPPLNRQQRRALRKQYRLEKQRRNTPTPVTQPPASGLAS